MSAVRNLGDSAIKYLIANRETEGPFNSLSDISIEELTRPAIEIEDLSLTIPIPLPFPIIAPLFLLPFVFSVSFVSFLLPL